MYVAPWCYKWANGIVGKRWEPWNLVPALFFCCKILKVFDPKTSKNHTNLKNINFNIEMGTLFKKIGKTRDFVQTG